MENASAIFYADAGFRRGTMGDGVVAHETAHQWFGDAVTERDWPHLWLSEGFATYFAALWTRAARGDSAFRVQMADIRQTILADSESVAKRPVIDTIETNLLALLNRNSYEKGGFVLHMLRNEVGERAFFNALRAYYATFKHATATTDDLRAAMEREVKRPMSWFFDQWLRRPGFPSVTAEWSYDAGAKEVAITVSQSSPFGNYQFPLTIAVIDSAGGQHRTTLTMPSSGAAGAVRVPLASAPANVVLDPDVALLAPLHVVRRSTCGAVSPRPGCCSPRQSLRSRVRWPTRSCNEDWSSRRKRCTTRRSARHHTIPTRDSSSAGISLRAARRASAPRWSRKPCNSGSITRPERWCSRRRTYTSASFSSCRGFHRRQSASVRLHVPGGWSITRCVSPH